MTHSFPSPFSSRVGFVCVCVSFRHLPTPAHFLCVAHSLACTPTCVCVSLSLRDGCAKAASVGKKGATVCVRTRRNSIAVCDVERVNRNQTVCLLRRGRASWCSAAPRLLSRRPCSCVHSRTLHGAFCANDNTRPARRDVQDKSAGAGEGEADGSESPAWASGETGQRRFLSAFSYMLFLCCATHPKRLSQSALPQGADTRTHARTPRARSCSLLPTVHLPAHPHRRTASLPQVLIM